jgi:hypothetical protein
MPSRCPMPSENLPARLPATASRPVSAITSSTRGSGCHGSRPSRAGGRVRCARCARPWHRAARRPP